MILPAGVYVIEVGSSLVYTVDIEGEWFWLQVKGAHVVTRH